MMNMSMDQPGAGVPILTAQDAAQNEFDRQYTAYLTLASTTLYIFDYLLTFEAEKKFVWRGRHGLATMLFFLIRYPPILIFGLNIYFLPFNATANTNFTQDALWYLRFSLTGWVAGCAGGILVLRTYALYSENKKHLLLTIPAMLAPIAFLTLAAFDSTVPMLEAVPVLGGTSAVQGILGNVTSSQQVISTCNDSDVIMPFAASVGFDIVIFTLTAARRVYRGRINKGISLLEIMVRDGALYFLTLVLANLITLLLVVHNPTNASSWAVVQISSLLTILLISRLFLNLRAAAYYSRQTDLGPTESNPPTMDLAFASRSQLTTTKARSGNEGFFGVWTFKGMIGLDDFTVDLPGLDSCLIQPSDEYEEILEIQSYPEKFSDSPV